jgi:hypothetical protein
VQQQHQRRAFVACGQGIESEVGSDGDMGEQGHVTISNLQAPANYHARLHQSMSAGAMKRT